MPERHYFSTRSEWLGLRSEDVTSTESAALFGLSPYLTAFELYQIKTGALGGEIDETERMRAGKLLEPVIAGMVSDEIGYKVRDLRCYMRHSTVPRMGSSFDYEVIGTGGRPWLLELKNVDRLVWRDQWHDGEAPEYIEIQVQHQLEVSDREVALLGVLVGGNELRIIRRQRDREMGQAIADAVAGFWAQVARRSPPAIDWNRDAGAIGRLYRSGSGPAVDLRGEADVDRIARRYLAAADAEKAASAEKEAAKAQLLVRIGDASKAIGDGWSISAGEVGEAEVSYTRKPYRNFRITQRKKETV